MRAGPVGRWARRAAILLLVAWAPVWAADRAPWPEPTAGARVRVSSGETASTVTVRVRPGAALEDRTTGARPATGPRGPLSAGQTFAGDITLFFPDMVAPRATHVDVDDPMISTVRLFPEAGGTSVVIFVRQPVTYTVARPSALGDVAIEVRSRVQPVRQAGTGPGGRPRFVRPPEPGEGEVAVDAEQLAYDQQAGVLTARGNVTVTRGNLTLTADEVRYDKKAATLDAKGHVVLVDPEATLDGDSAHVNLDDEAGWVEPARGEMLTSGYSLECGRFVKKGGPVYEVRDGEFTTCRCGGLEKPTWSIGGKQTDVRLDGAGVTRHATFRVKDIPVFYFPYLVFPANTSRQSGFLIPTGGNSSRNGVHIEVPYYWAIDKSSDLSVAVDVETKARVGALAEYRYALSRAGRGRLSVGYFSENIRGLVEGTRTAAGVPVDAPENRFGILGHHVQRVGRDAKVFVDMLAVSDRTFLKEVRPFPLFGPRDRFLRFTTNRVGFVRAWDDGMVRADATYWQDLEGQAGITPKGLPRLESTQDVTVQRLPRVQATHGFTLVEDWVYAGVDAEGENFHRERGYAGLRGDLSPHLTLPFHAGRFLNGSVTARAHLTGYDLMDREQVGLVQTESGSMRILRDVSTLRPVLPSGRLGALDRLHGRPVGELYGRLGTELARVYPFRHWGLERLRHTIEPELRYLFVPDLGTERQQARLPPCSAAGPAGVRGRNCFDEPARVFTVGYLFDELDAISERNFMSWGLTTRLLGRAGATADLTTASGGDATADAPAKADPPPPVRELLRLSLLHGYDFSRVIAGTSHGSDVEVQARVSPAGWLSLIYDTTTNVERGDVIGQRAALVLRDPWWAPGGPRSYQTATTLGLAYQFVAPGSRRGFQEGSVDQVLLRGKDTGLEEIGGIAYLAATQHLGFFFRAVYDLTVPGGRFKERSYFMRLLSRCNCWMLDVGFRDQFNPDDRSLVFQFTLVGLGSYGHGTGRELLPAMAPGTFPTFRRGGGY